MIPLKPIAAVDVESSSSSNDIRNDNYTDVRNGTIMAIMSAQDDIGHADLGATVSPNSCPRSSDDSCNRLNERGTQPDDTDDGRGDGRSDGGSDGRGDRRSDGRSAEEEAIMSGCGSRQGDVFRGGETRASTASASSPSLTTTTTTSTSPILLFQQPATHASISSNTNTTPPLSTIPSPISCVADGHRATETGMRMRTVGEFQLDSLTKKEKKKKKIPKQPAFAV
jgi:hypothetical protein